MFIAEIGINHHGDVECAKKLIIAAKNAGCDAVKFQYRSSDFYQETNQIGDEILSAEIARTDLTSDQIIELIEFSHGLDLKAGVSFFRLSDFQSNGSFRLADFYKVPSAEHMNLHLIDGLLTTDKQIFLSTGGANLEKLALLLGDDRRPAINVMHCIANYPVAFGYERLNYIAQLKTYGYASVGYSSHDAEFLTCLVAMGVGIDSLERHIVLDKNDGGLDSSSSSTPSEMTILGMYFSRFCSLKHNSEPLQRNQGEILNMQNLGTGLYAREALEQGKTPNLNSFEIKAPRLGMSVGEFLHYFSDAELLKPIEIGEPLLEKHFRTETLLSQSSAGLKEFKYVEEFNVGLPIRLHDWDKVRQKFPISTFEFHLSFGEVLGSDFYELIKKIDKHHRYSIHLPDYIARNQLIDLFSENPEVVSKSVEIVRRTLAFGRMIEDRTGRPVPVVGSFPFTLDSPDLFVQSLLDKLTDLGGKNVLPQWLPVHGWYFGGFSRIQTFNSQEYINAVKKFDCKICLDVSHLIMSANFYNDDWREWYDQLLPHAAHIHLSDATGMDGEGLAFGSGALKGESLQVPRSAMTILEVWQGHLRDFEGFEAAINFIEKQRILRV